VRIVRMLTGLAVVTLVSGSFVVTGGSVGVQAASAACASVPRPGLPIRARRPANAPPATKNYTPVYYTNWSGYGQKVSTATGPYTAVRDYWTVPRVDTGLSGNQSSSDWVGIDEGNSSGGDLVQDGTEADNIGGKAQYDAWTEILPAAECKIPDLTIHPGDQIEGLAEETSHNVWKMTVYDLTTGKSGGRTVTYNASDGGPAAQTSAEAVHERPCLAKCNTKNPVLATLTQTTSVTFDPGSYSTAAYMPAWKPLLTAAPGATVDRIFMQNTAGTATLATPSVPSASAEGFTVADGSAAPPAPWGTAEEVPGLAALNAGGGAGINAVSCASAGNCSAGGGYTGNSDDAQGFVVNETGGTWSPAEEVPGLAALNTGGTANLLSVSCASAGNCSASGLYTVSSGTGQGFVVNETGGTWGTAQEIPGLAALNTGGDARSYSVSCGAAGNCSAVGYYVASSGDLQGFVVSETGGTWGTAKEVPGLAALNTGGTADIYSVSCTSAGNCSAGGQYSDKSGASQGFVVNETGGHWDTAKPVPGLAALNTGGGAGVDSVSCASAGNCSAGGGYTGNSSGQAFVASETGGTWGTAEDVPGLASLYSGGGAAVSSLSCPAPGNCSAGGEYGTRHSIQAFVAGEPSV
jgi:Peptidase A4 family